MAETGSMSEVASQSLDLVSQELTNTLESARSEIEDFVDGHGDKEALLRAASMLHLAAGALKIVEIHGAALLAEEMEQTCAVLTELEDADAVDQGVEALTRAMVQLPAYLERLLAGGSDVALVLLPLLNDLRTVRNKPLMSEGTLLLLNTGPFERFASSHDPSVQPEKVTSELPAIAQRLRPAFQSALLGWIRGQDEEACLGTLTKAAQELGDAAQTESVKALWQVLLGVLVALATGGLEATVQLKRLVGQADRQLKRLIDSGETYFITSPPSDLINSLLYYVARARSDDPRIEALREQFDLKDIIPGEEQIEAAREKLSGPSVKLMQTVSHAIKEDLSAVKDVLDIFVRTGMQDVGELKSQIDMLKKIGDTLGVLGLDAARNQIQVEVQHLSVLVANDRVDDPSVLEKTAAVLLDVEDALARELMRAVTPAESEADEESAHYRHVTQAVMGECIVNLAKVKDSVIRVVADPTSVRVLDQIEPQLRGITAGLLMLNKTKAVKIVERIGKVIQTRLAQADAPLRQDHLERLADAIVSVEYYMETISIGRSDPWYMLDNAQRCIDLLERLPVGVAAPPKSDEEEAAPAHDEPAAPDEVSIEDTASLQVMEVAEDRSEPELVEIFIEEAKEEIANIKRYLPAWLESPSSSEALISVRRSFHTLKGSGRMVGAQLLGEFAWSVENLLNRFINQTLAATPPMFNFVREAAGALPRLIEQLETGIKPDIDVQLLMKRAEAFAEGDPDAESLTSESLRVQVGQLGGDAAAGMDPVLAEIFTKEVREHLTAIRSYIDRTTGPEPHTVDEPVYRACHTLFGSAKMAQSQDAIALAQPLDKHLGSAFDTGRGLSDQGLKVLAEVVGEFERLASSMESEQPFELDRGVVDRLGEIAPVADAAADREHAHVEVPEAPELPEAPEWPEAPVEAEAPVQTEEPPVHAAVPASPGPEAPVSSVAYDPEIAAIFAEEATELLDQAETGLQDLSTATDAPGALRELQRVLHTLKGGARMAGIGVMGDLSHSLESLLSGMAEGRLHCDDGAVRLIQECLDRLHQMRDGIDAGQSLRPAEALIARIDARARGEVEPAVEEAEAPPSIEEAGAEVGDSTLSDIEEIVLDEEAPVVATQPQLPAHLAPSREIQVPGTTAEAPEVVDEPVAAEPVASDAEVSDARGAPAQRAPERAEMARVDAGVLDTLLNAAGEISIFQSRINQQLHSIDFHLTELGQTVTRLREQLRKLEAETEAQILHRHQDDTEDDQDFDPLELDRYSTIQQLSRALAESSNDVASINELLSGLASEADTLLTQQTRVTTELQDGLMQTRMVAFSSQVPRLSRIVRQAAQDTGKAVELSVEGGESQLDRQVLERVLPALEHLLRNAVVHGIETSAAREAAGKPSTGTVSLRLRRDGAEVIVDVGDDGAGLKLAGIRRRAEELGLMAEGREASDEEIIEFILRPGFSTADELTQTAGRGVGMDVVDNEVKKLGGSMRIETEQGQGTHFIIRLPYTLAITHALIVTVGEETFALPLPTVEGITRVKREQLLEILKQDDPHLTYGDVSYRVQHLGSLVGSAPSPLPEDEQAVSLVLIRAGENSTALLTDLLEGSREIVVKTMGPHLASIAGISGATILGDGRVTVILDPVTLVRAQLGDDEIPEAAPVAEKQMTALVVDDSITMRRVTQRLLERRGVRVLTARDGLDAIEVLQEHEADIVLLDIEMPRMDGYQFATHVRNDANLKDLPIIMVTSRSGEKHRAKAIEVGVNDYLSKPYQEAQLVAAMESLLGRSL